MLCLATWPARVTVQMYASCNGQGKFRAHPPTAKHGGAQAAFPKGTPMSSNKGLRTSRFVLGKGMGTCFLFLSDGAYHSCAWALNNLDVARVGQPKNQMAQLSQGARHQNAYLSSMSKAPKAPKATVMRPGVSDVLGVSASLFAPWGLKKQLWGEETGHSFLSFAEQFA